jgi:lysophospholipase L1-like esterase
MVSVLSGCGGGGGDGGDGVGTAPTYPPAAVIFSDSFDDGSGWTSRWAIENDTSQPDSWLSASGVLLQQNNVIDLDESYHTGTFARLADASMTGESNYRFSVDITPQNNVTGGTYENGNDIGIMFRYQNENNYYRVSMSARYGFTRLEKRRSGIFETLAVNSRGYVENQTTTITAEVNGSSIIVWIDGDPVFAEEDSSIISGTVALYSQDRAWFDNVRITETPLNPVVAISSPLAYSVTPGNPVNLSAVAVVFNKPAGGSVAFSLDGGPELTTAGSGHIYSREFTNVSAGNHDIAAVVRYADGTEASSDTNSMVGTGGDYYVSVGDSITNGYGDEDDSNNDSIDGRMVAIQGFQARLSDLLTAETGLPQIVFNEGIPGDTALDLNGRIDSILDRHPKANKGLLMIGTNDSNNINNVDPVDFKADVEAIADFINGRGKTLWLAKTMPTYLIGSIPSNPQLDDSRNLRIEAYNQRIQDIINVGDGLAGPDFYAIFNDPSLYDSYLHPNDLGYRTMANYWRIPLP